LEDVVHKGDDNTFKVQEDDVEIGSEDANKRKRLYTEKKIYSKVHQKE